MSIEPIRSEPPDTDQKPIVIPVVFHKAVTPEDENGLREWEETTEEFRCRPFVNAGVLNGLDAMYGSSVSRTGGGAVFDLFDAAFLPESHARWHEVRFSPDYNISSRAVAQVAQRLYEVYTARPTRSPSGT